MVAIYVLLLLAVTALTYADDCPALFRRYSKDHTYCKAANPQCKFVMRGLYEGNKDTILKNHNLYRSRVAQGNENTQSLPSATNMMQIEWDNTLAAVAQKHADQCSFEHDCNDCRRVSDFGVGQNLFQRNFSGQNLQPDWKMAVKGWYDEVNVFNRNNRSPFVFTKPTGHFTQVVWADTWKVGCGYSMVDLGSGLYQELYTCNYGPGGNMGGATMYKDGQQCSGCPTNACCDGSCSGKGTTSDYPGLCKMLKQEAPQYPSAGDDSFFKCTFRDEADCSIGQVDGANKWQIMKTLSGNYMTIVLNGGEKSTLTFANILKPSTNPFCLKFFYRKGPNVDGEQALEGTVKAIYVIPSMNNYKVTNSLKGLDKSFTQFTMTFGWDAPTQVSFEFSVPAGKPAQYFEVSDMSASKCN